MMRFFSESFLLITPAESLIQEAQFGNADLGQTGIKPLG
jgi:hypothetical protein